MPPLLQSPTRSRIPGIPVGGWDLIAGPGVFGTYATVGTLGDGRIIVSGTATYTLDPDTLVWTTQPTAANAQTYGNGSVNENGDYVFMGGGVDATTSIFDQGTNTWAVSTTHPDYSKLLSGGMTLANGLVYLTGGSEFPNAAGAATYTFNSGTEAWTHLVGDDITKAGFFIGMTTLADGNILVCGGEDNSVLTDRAFIYDIGTTTWSEINVMPAVTSQHGIVTVPNGLVWTLGAGVSSFVYNPDTGLWSTGPALPGAISTGAYMTGIFPDGRVIITTSANTWISIA